MPACKVCTKSVYPMDPQVNLDGILLHKACAKCQDCNCQISLSNFTKNETKDNFTLLCKIHYFKRFRENGNYPGAEQFQKSKYFLYNMLRYILLLISLLHCFRC